MTSLLLLLAALALPVPQPADANWRLVAPSDLVLGDSMIVQVTGLAPRERLTMTAERDLRLDSSTVVGLPAGVRRFRLSLSLRADARGVVHQLIPLWQLAPAEAAIAPDTIGAGRVRVRVAARGERQEGVTRLRRVRGAVITRYVRVAGLDGAFSAPGDGRRYPVVILLHGSGGGDSVSALRLAERFASQGVAAFAMNYVVYAYGRAPLPGVPSAFVNVPIESVDRARAWIGEQPEADTSRTGLWGVSKGAEFAAVIASRRSWPRAVVACVASDVVWSGFGAPPVAGQRLSSWSSDGVGLANIPYDRYEDVFSGLATARTVHARSRQRHADSVPAARIAVEQITAPTLLMGSTHDEVWPSATMVSAMTRAMQRAGRAPVQQRRYPQAGHGICGDGTTPAAFFPGRELPTREPPDQLATARAGADAWVTTLAFLRERLGGAQP
jgi:dienelactone hydrolase